jgi:hypothetical protein
MQHLASQRYCVFREAVLKILFDGEEYVHYGQLYVETGWEIPEDPVERRSPDRRMGCVVRRGRAFSSWSPVCTPGTWDSPSSSAIRHRRWTTSGRTSSRSPLGRLVRTWHWCSGQGSGVAVASQAGGHARPLLRTRDGPGPASRHHPRGRTGAGSLPAPVLARSTQPRSGPQRPAPTPLTGTTVRGGFPHHPRRRRRPPAPSRARAPGAPEAL